MDTKISLPKTLIDKINDNIDADYRTIKMRDISDDLAYWDASHFLKSSEKSDIYQSDLHENIRIPYEQARRVMDMLVEEGHVDDRGKVLNNEDERRYVITENEMKQLKEEFERIEKEEDASHQLDYKKLLEKVRRR